MTQNELLNHLVRDWAKEIEGVERVTAHRHTEDHAQVIGSDQTTFTFFLVEGSLRGKLSVTISDCAIKDLWDFHGATVKEFVIMSMKSELEYLKEDTDAKDTTSG